MIRNRRVNATIQLILVLTGTSGCDERVVEVAREAADRQAAQNQQMGELQTEVARGTRSLVEANAAARQEMVGVHRDLQAERQQLGTGWNALETQRQQLARQRRTDSLLLPLACAVGGLALVTVLIGFLWQLLANARSSGSIDGELNELLIKQVLASDTWAPRTERSHRFAGPQLAPPPALPPADSP
jgi:hypothetical protein